MLPSLATLTLDADADVKRNRLDVPPTTSLEDLGADDIKNILLNYDDPGEICRNFARFCATSRNMCDELKWQQACEVLGVYDRPKGSSGRNEKNVVEGFQTMEFKQIFLALCKGLTTLMNREQRKKWLVGARDPRAFEDMRYVQRLALQNLEKYEKDNYGKFKDPVPYPSPELRNLMIHWYGPGWDGGRRNYRLDRNFLLAFERHRSGTPDTPPYVSVPAHVSTRALRAQEIIDNIRDGADVNQHTEKTVWDPKKFVGGGGWVETTGPVLLLDILKNGESTSYGMPLGLELLLKSSNLDVNVENSSRQSALWIASFKKHSKAVEELIQRGADVDHADYKYRTPLMMACSSGDRQSVQSLLDAGADWSRVDEDGRNAFKYAKRRAKEYENALKRGAQRFLLGNYDDAEYFPMWFKEACKKRDEKLYGSQSRDRPRSRKK